MANLLPITLARHRDRRWAPYAGYHFAAADAVAPLVAQELPKALMSLPIGLIQQPQGFGLVAVQSLQPGQNLFVSAEGRWLGGYVPALYRCYPFALVKTEGKLAERHGRAKPALELGAMFDEQETLSFNWEQP